MVINISNKFFCRIDSTLETSLTNDPGVKSAIDEAFRPNYFNLYADNDEGFNIATIIKFDISYREKYECVIIDVWNQEFETYDAIKLMQPDYRKQFVKLQYDFTDCKYSSLETLIEEIRDKCFQFWASDNSLLLERKDEE